MLLARNQYMLEQYGAVLRDEGLLYEGKQGLSIGQEKVAAITTWEALRKGRELPVQHIIKVYEHMTAGVGYKRGSKGKLDAAGGMLSLTGLQADYGLQTQNPWYEALTKIGEADREYLRAALARGESLTKPRIRVSTIHGAKGGEADNVAVMTDMAYRCYQEQEIAPDNERRVFYVAATRAKQNLFWLAPQTMRAFEG